MNEGLKLEKLSKVKVDLIKIDLFLPRLLEFEYARLYLLGHSALTLCQGLKTRGHSLFSGHRIEPVSSLG